MISLSNSGDFGTAPWSFASARRFQIEIGGFCRLARRRGMAVACARTSNNARREKMRFHTIALVKRTTRGSGKFGAGAWAATRPVCSSALTGLAVFRSGRCIACHPAALGQLHNRAPICSISLPFGCQASARTWRPEGWLHHRRQCRGGSAASANTVADLPHRST